MGNGLLPFFVMGVKQKSANIELISKYELKDLEQLLPRKIIIDGIGDLEQRVELEVFQLQGRVCNLECFKNDLLVLILTDACQGALRSVEGTNER